jgi:four helix bundle suffix protein
MTRLWAKKGKQPFKLEWKRHGQKRTFTEEAEMSENLIPTHGGYRKLKTFQLSQLIHDLTVEFVESFVDARSRTRDQMVQAARSGKQNIAEGSRFSATSRKLELKLTNAARSSLEELRLDYEDFLRQRRLPQWPPTHAALKRFRLARPSTLDQVFKWAVKEEQRVLSKPQIETTVAWALSPGRDSPCRSVLLANAALSLLNLGCHLLDRQIESQAKAFETEGGFTERMYRVRQSRKNQEKAPRA